MKNRIALIGFSGTHRIAMKITSFLKHTLILGVLLLATACSTTYKSEGFTGGYSEIQLSEDIYRISFRGNGYTSTEKASDFTLMRAAEIGLQKGFTHFAVVENDERIDTRYAAPRYSCSAIGNNVDCRSHGGGSTQKPRTVSTVQYFRINPIHASGAVYDTKVVFNSISEKYNLKREMQSENQ